ncbi:MAG: hypothetical protein ACI8WB_004807, partial [Phenylobacterium sp.]
KTASILVMYFFIVPQGYPLCKMGFKSKYCIVNKAK